MSVRSAYCWMKARPRLAAVGAVSCVALTGGAAYAATHPSESSVRQAVLADAAKRLGVSPAALDGALKQAQIDQVEKAVKAGRLTQAQADAIIAGIKAGRFGPPLAPGPFGFGFRFRDHDGFRFGGHGMMGERGLGMFQAAATYLSLSPRELFAKLSGGKTLAQVAAGEDKVGGGLDAAMLQPMQIRLDAAVKKGFLTSAQEQQMLARTKTFIADMVTGRLPHLRLDPDAWRGGGMFAGPAL